MGRDFCYQVQDEIGNVSEESEGWRDLRTVVPFLSRRNNQMEDREQHTTVTLANAIFEAAQGLVSAVHDRDERTAQEWNERIFALSVVYSDMSPTSLALIRYQ